MSRADDRTDRLLQAYYSRAQVEPSTAARLVSLAAVDQGRSPSSVRKGPRLRTVVLAFALTFVAAVTSYQYLLPIQSVAPGSAQTAASPVKTARLVALRFQVDWCPYSKATAPVFTDLVMKYGNTRVQFAVFNMTDEAQMAASREMAKRIGVDWIIPVAGNSGKVFLVDPDRQLIFATLKTPEDRDRWAAALERELLH